MYIDFLPTPSKLALFRDDFKKNLGNNNKLISSLFGFLSPGMNQIYDDIWEILTLLPIN